MGHCFQSILRDFTRVLNPISWESIPKFINSLLPCLKFQTSCSSPQVQFPGYSPSSYQLILANFCSFLSSLTRISMFLAEFCFRLTVVINPVIWRKGKGRSWTGGLLFSKRKCPQYVPTRGEWYLLRGMGKSPLQLWSFSGIWRAKVFRNINPDIPISCVRIPGFPNHQSFNYLSSLATLSNPELSIQFVLVQHCRTANHKKAFWQYLTVNLPQLSTTPP